MRKSKHKKSALSAFKHYTWYILDRWVGAFSFVLRQSHITQILLKELHLLPIKYCIEYKLLLITYKALNGQAPSYISGMIEKYKPSRSLRSESSLQLKHPPGLLKRSYGKRSFQRTVPLLWNALPEDARNAESLSMFKCLLKTYYFKKHYIQNEAI